jgi:hypothetical protein
MFDYGRQLEDKGLANISLGEQFGLANISLGEQFGLYGLFFNLAQFLNAIIPYAYNLTGKPSLNDAYQFLRVYNLAFDMFFGGLLPATISLLGGFAYLIAWYFAISLVVETIVLLSLENEN